MLAKIRCYGVVGIEAYPIEIEVDVNWGLPAVIIVGMADTTIKESKARVKAAIKNSGFSWPQERITISLAPSEIRKEGANFDLAIALGILAASEQIAQEATNEFVFIGELALDGALRPCKGVLPVAMHLARQAKRNLLIPFENAQEAAIVPAAVIWPVRTLRETVDLVSNPALQKPYIATQKPLLATAGLYPIDFADVKGQYAAKRAVEVAVAGGHNIALIGPPGCGKTMLAQRIPTIMPDLSYDEALEVTQIHSVAGLSQTRNGLLTTRPFRNPHHTISCIGLIGGGTLPQPGEISMAHKGVLFLDELPEFRRDCLESLRQPLEEGVIRISRIRRSLVFPSSCMLVAAFNPCPCGHLTDPHRACRCNTSAIAHYRRKLSGPLLDRIDIHIEIPPARYQEISSDIPTENSLCIRSRIQAARAMQQERFRHETVSSNAHMSHKQVRKFCVLGKEEGELLKTAMSELNFSARAYDKILKIARSIADLAESAQITTEHLAEAVQYRSLDKDF